MAQPPHTAPIIAATSPAPSPHPAVVEFAAGVEGCLPPAPEVAALGAELVQAASAKLGAVRPPEFSVDVDGALAFDLRLNDGRLVFAELSVAGTLAFSVYGLNDALAQSVDEADPAALLNLFQPSSGEL